MGAEVHVREVDPHKHRLASFGLFLDELRRASRDVVIDGLHALLGQRAGILDFLCSVRQCPGVNYTPWAELLAKAGEIRILWIVREFRFFLCVEVVEVSVEFVKAVICRQVLVSVTEMILAKLPGGVALRLEQFCNCHIPFLQAKGRARHAHFGIARSQSDLARNERGAARRTALLAVVVGEHHPLFGDPVDVGGLVSHQPL